MNIAVFGLGYVGACTAGCLSKDGHIVIGVDPVKSKINTINSGQSQISEPSLDQMISTAVAENRLSATDNFVYAVDNTELCFICVGTPSNDDGSIDLVALRTVCNQIGNAVAERERPYLVVVRSTVLPGTIRKLVIPLLEKVSNSKIGEKFDVLFHPEFLREGSSVSDFFDPPKIVIGQRNPDSARQLLSIYTDRYPGPRVICDFETAEMVKYSDNIFHALKISFANEIDRFCQPFGIDSNQVMEIFCHDKKLNISKVYLNPGFAFGGSCLPKDLRAFAEHANRNEIELPVIQSILQSNQSHMMSFLRRIEALNPLSVGIYGLSFKAGTDDLRESPSVQLVELLLENGYVVKIFDEMVVEAELLGQNKAHINERLPKFSELMVENVDMLCDTDLILLTHPINPSRITRWRELGKTVLDLTNTPEKEVASNFQIYC